jgi:penicillin-binding protein 1A
MRTSRGPAALFVMLSLVAGGCAMPRIDQLEPRELAQTSFLYASDGSLITEFHAVEDRVVLTAEEMSPFLRDATVAIEDRRFYQHHGVDLQAILRAAYVNAQAGTVIEGGSTITQQLVKNIYVGGAVTFRRKFDEAALAWQLEDRLSKEEILTEYLNTVYFGEGAYGAQSAARTYFDEDAADLSLAQAATLAGLISSPNHFDPFRRRRAAVGRRGVVLELMRRQGTIGARQFRRATDERMQVNRGRVEEEYPFPYFVDYVKRWFAANPAFGETEDERFRLLFTGGLRITTTIDPELQHHAERAVHSVLAYPSDPEGAMTVLDPRTGFVRAMVGGTDSEFWSGRRGGKVNLATGAGGRYGRQTGSAFKPFALVTALENGISPDSVFPAPSEIEIPIADGKVWHVTNAEGSGYGSMTLESATVNSVNTVYAQLIEQLGPQKVIEVARRMGMRCCTDVGSPESKLQPYLSAVLGTNGVNSLEMASAYGTIASGGLRVAPIPIQSVVDAHGDVLWEADPNPKQVLHPQVAAAAGDILQEAVLFGTGTAANIGRPQLGKTGTAADHTNAWFIGAVPQLVAAVWVGYPQGQIAMEPPRTRITVFGGTWPAQIWRLFMLRAVRGLPARGFPTPAVDYIDVAVDVTQDPLCLPNRFTLPQNVDVLSFIEGTEPTKTCKLPDSLQLVPVPSVVGLPQSTATNRLEQAGFFVEVQVVESTQPPGTVIGQTPSAGTSAYQTSTVTITVSKAPTPVDDR